VQQTLQNKTVVKPQALLPFLFHSANLSIFQTGTIVSVATQTAQSTINLPAAASSAGYTFDISISAVTNAFNLLIATASSETTLNGTSIASGGTLTVQSGKQQITLVQAHLSVGDRVLLECDGTSWLMQCISTNSGAAFTFA